MDPSSDETKREGRRILPTLKPLRVSRLGNELFHVIRIEPPDGRASDFWASDYDTLRFELRH